MSLKANAARSRGLSMNEAATETFNALFAEHWEKITQVLFRLIGDYSEAEDLAMEVFWRLYQNPPKHLDGANNISGWLYRVATNLGYNALRARRRRAFYERAADEDHPEALDVTANEVEQRIERGRVQAVLRAMRPRSAKVLILRHSGLTYAEIAAATGLAPGSVGTVLARAQQDFAKRFAALEGEHHETS